MNNISTVIIQAGGLGTRLLPHTLNKPKCLVPLNGKPILEYNLQKFKNCKIIIIGDYKIDILQSYIDTFYKEYNINIVKATGTGTCSGLKDALHLVKDEEPICLIWSDLILEEDIEHDKNFDIQVYTTNSFPCRYKFKNKKIIKELTNKSGIIGLFTFKNKNYLSDLPESGSFVGEWLKNKTDIIKKNINHVKEIGTLDSLKKESNKLFCRFFNKVSKKNNKIIKECIHKKYNNVHEDEKNWYQHLVNKNYGNIPKIYSFNPLTLQYIKSRQCHIDFFSEKEKIIILENLIKALENLHSIETIDSNYQDINKIYVKKTLERVQKTSGVIPFFEHKELIINNVLNKNPFHPENYEKFINDLNSIKCKKYNIIHGDPTFSNILIKNNLEIVFIDPRGSFGDTKIYGDRDYDLAKLFYSLNGNYDSINLKKYNINYVNNIVDYNLTNSGWSNLTDNFYKLSNIDKNKNLLLNSSIWFSLCGYTIEDFDSILIAFIKGVEYWNLTL